VTVRNDWCTPAVILKRARAVRAGIDVAEWNPETDPHIAPNFFSADDPFNKTLCKKYAALGWAGLGCTVLCWVCCAVLCCAVLCCAVLCCHFAGTTPLLSPHHPRAAQGVAVPART